MITSVRVCYDPHTTQRGQIPTYTWCPGHACHILAFGRWNNTYKFCEYRKVGTTTVYIVTIQKRPTTIQYPNALPGVGYHWYGNPFEFFKRLASNRVYLLRFRQPWISIRLVEYQTNVFFSPENRLCLKYKKCFVPRLYYNSSKPFDRFSNSHIHNRRIDAVILSFLSSIVKVKSTLRRSHENPIQIICNVISRRI